MNAGPASEDNTIVSMRVLDAVRSDGVTPGSAPGPAARGRSLGFVALALAAAAIAGSVVWYQQRQQAPTHDPIRYTPTRTATTLAPNAVVPVVVAAVPAASAASVASDALAGATPAAVATMSGSVVTPVQTAAVAAALAEDEPSVGDERKSSKSRKKKSKKDKAGSADREAKSRKGDALVATGNGDKTGKAAGGRGDDLAKTPAPTAAGKVAGANAAVDADAAVVAAIMARLDKGPTDRSAPMTARETATIADLVARCKEQPKDEAKACRKRICEGYWGRAEACPKSQAPKSSSSKKKKKKTAPDAA